MTPPTEQAHPRAPAPARAEAPAWRPPGRFSSERGSVLLAALCFSSVLALAMASYIALCYRTLEISSRTIQSTRSIELAETGMEEVLWALNNSSWSGWTITGTTATKTITGFTYDNNITGEISLSVTNYSSSSGTRTITATGTTHQPNGRDLTRTLTATSTQAPLFVNALAGTTSTVVFSNGGTADSYDSSLGTYASQTPSYSAVVASTATSAASANVQLVNAQIKGYVASTYLGGPSYSTSGRVYGPTTPGATRIDQNRVSSSAYQPVFAIRTPTGSGTVLAAPATNSIRHIGTSGATTPSIYYCSGLDLTGTTQIVVDGPVQLVMTGSGAFYIGLHGGTPQVQITSTGSLEVFCAGDIAIYGNGISNATNDPKKCAVYGTNTLTVPDMNTTTPYIGVIYTPTGYFTVAGNSTIYGAIVAKKISLTGTTPVIHYDLSLRTAVFAGLETPYAISDVRETTNEG